MNIDELWDKYKAIDIIKGLDDADGIMTKRNFTLAISEEISSPVEPEVILTPTAIETIKNLKDFLLIIAEKFDRIINNNGEAYAKTVKQIEKRHSTVLEMLDKYQKNDESYVETLERLLKNKKR